MEKEKVTKMKGGKPMSINSPDGCLTSGQQDLAKSQMPDGTSSDRNPVNGNIGINGDG